MDNKTDNVMKRKPGRPKKLENHDNTLPAADPVKRKRGRPAGSKNKSIRKDHDINGLTKKGDNAKILSYSLALTHLPIINYEDPEQVKQRLEEFYNITIQYDTKLTVACLALCFAFDRFTLFNVLNGKSNRIKNVESIHIIKTAYDMITAQYEQLMNNGKINPVAGIFMMKNNFAYKDTTDYIITSNQEREENHDDIYNRAGLLQDID